MASLVEELTNTLRMEDEIYRKLLPIEEKKTEIIVKNDLVELQKVTEQEQEVVGSLIDLEKKREEIVKNIATVISKDPKSLKVRELIDMLNGQPEQKQLAKVYESLSKTMERLVEMNNRNKTLIEHSLEMIAFNMNFYQSLRSVSANSYNKGANTYENGSYSSGIFDTKQ